MSENKLKQDAQAKDLLLQLKEGTDESAYGEPQAYLDLSNGGPWKSPTRSMGCLKSSSITPARKLFR